MPRRQEPFSLVRRPGSPYWYYKLGPWKTYKSTGKKDTATLATVGPTAILATDLAHRINEMAPLVRKRYRRSPRLVEQLVESTIADEMILSVARKRGYDRDPRIQALVRRHLISLVKEDVYKLVTLKSISDQEVDAYIRKHPDKFPAPPPRQGDAASPAGTDPGPSRQARVLARAALFRERRAQTYDKFLRELSQATPVRRYPDRFDQVTRLIRPGPP